MYVDTRYGSGSSTRRTLELGSEGGHVRQAVRRDAAIVMFVTIPGTFPSPSPNVTAAPAISGSAVQVQLSPPIRLDTNKKWQIVPYLFSIPYTTPNLGPAGALAPPGFPDGNSRVTMSIGAVPSADLVLAAGLYGIDDIALAFNLFAQGAGWIADAVSNPIFSITGFNATQQAIITINPTNILAGAWGAAGQFPVGGITLNFTNPSPNSGLNDSMGAMLGFTTATILVYDVAGGAVTPISMLSPNRADLARLTGIIVNSNIATGAFRDGSSSNAIGVVPLGNETPNTIVKVDPSFEKPVPVGQFIIDSFTLYFTDQRGNYLPSFREDAQVDFGIEEVHD